MKEDQMTGRVTIPTDVDVVAETLEIMKRWGADAIRDCDGTDYPTQLRETNAKVCFTVDFSSQHDCKILLKKDVSADS